MLVALSLPWNLGSYKITLNILSLSDQKILAILQKRELLGVSSTTETNMLLDKYERNYRSIYLFSPIYLPNPLNPFQGQKDAGANPCHCLVKLDIWWWAPSHNFLWHLELTCNVSSVFFLLRFVPFGFYSPVQHQRDIGITWFKRVGRFWHLYQKHRCFHVNQTHLVLQSTVFPVPDNFNFKMSLQSSFRWWEFLCFVQFFIFKNLQNLYHFMS